MIATLLAVLALQGSLDAQARQFNCGNPQAQMEMNACADIDFQRADAELNRVYRDSIAAERQADRELDRTYDHGASNESILRDAQRAWVAFRDAQCTYEGNAEARGGSMEPMIYSGCQARLTRERIAQLSPPAEEAH